MGETNEISNHFMLKHVTEKWVSCVVKKLLSNSGYHANTFYNELFRYHEEIIFYWNEIRK